MGNLVLQKYKQQYKRDITKLALVIRLYVGMI